MQFSDGYLDLIIIKNCPKLPLLSMLSELNKGGHVKSPYLTYLKVWSSIRFSSIFFVALTLSFENGVHWFFRITKLTFVSCNKLQVKAFSLQPGTRTNNLEKEGIIDSDGEVLARGKGTYKSEQKTLMAYNKLQITVDQGLATLFTPSV